MLGPRDCPTNWNDGLSPLRCELRIPSAVTVVFSHPVRETKARSVEWQQARTPVKVYRVKVLRTRTSARYLTIEDLTSRSPLPHVPRSVPTGQALPPAALGKLEKVGTWDHFGDRRSPPYQ